jgi:hypothetical protein
MGLANPISFGLVRHAKNGAPDARRAACVHRTAHGWVYKADIIKFFDQLDRDVLKRAILKAVRRPSLHPLLFRFVDTEIEGGFDRDWRNIIKRAGIEIGLGVRQGMPLSPYFAGIYLRDLDRRLVRLGVPIIRYVDDIVAFFDTESDCYKFHRKLVQAVTALGLNLGEPNQPGSKTHIYPPDQPAPFLGMEITPRPDGTCCLMISTSTIDKIASKFDDAGSVSGLLDRKVSLIGLQGFFSSLRQGYLSAYDGASNRDDLRDRMDKCAGKAVQAVLREVFGNRMDTMSDAHKRFAGILEE